METPVQIKSSSENDPITAEKTIFSVLIAISFSHLLNDTMQSLIPSIYPLVKTAFRLNFAQVGLITLTFQLTASLLQPLVGLFTDRHPLPFSLAAGMGFTLLGLVSLAVAGSFGMLLLSVGMVGLGSAVFHPESSRLAHMASGGKHGMAQSLFQLGGNTGSSIGPLVAAAIIVPYGRFYVIWFSLAALIGMLVLWRVGGWYRDNLSRFKKKARVIVLNTSPALSSRKVSISLFILLALIFSKFFYLSSMTSYYTFYLMEKFHISLQNSQIHLFIFLFAVALGTMIGGPLGDRIGRKYVIWASILGVAPFTLLMPHADLLWTSILSVIIGLILSSAFPAILVYAQELVPGKVGMISGLFFGLAFGMGGLGSALLGVLADKTSLRFVYEVCAFLPFIGLLTGFLPNIGSARKALSD
ncbi:MAG TPA: MFS transporter [Chitinophagaceae bacterium]|nr:MFS transporter [Chitinophagaceae bacterium]